ncbi:MAG TPA: prepilin-type N-terminal cleavage/methylation domain-containing protein [Candidatus Saccharimonadales bacterium]|nr:prepilin-type N-terminal cleavage/methylation domain-containing protein [Candidatus Saccharimonadales bacterium]
MIRFKTIMYKTQKGFTLLEVLLVVAIIAILAGIVIIAINPGKNLQDTRNEQRQEDVTTILDAVYQYSLDNSGSVPGTIPSGASSASAQEICKTGTAGATCTAGSLVDFSTVTTSGKYIASVPVDPSCPTNCNGNGVGYKIYKDSTTGRITVLSQNTDGKVLSVTR